MTGYRTHVKDLRTSVLAVKMHAATTKYVIHLESSEVFDFVLENMDYIHFYIPIHSIRPGLWQSMNTE